MLLLLPAALANGLTTHVTICQDAVTLLPEGDLRTLLEAHPQELQNGAQLPDGGYPLGEGYAEIAHWEPFQQGFRESLGDAPWEDPYGQQLLAFNLGESCHGMGDQVFDSLYIEQVLYHDAESDYSYSFDTATDVAIAVKRAPQAPPERFLPTDELLPVFATLGEDTTADVLTEGQGLTDLALQLIGLTANNPDEAQTQMDWFPWASEHILDHDVMGNPWDESLAVAAYWQVIWGRLTGDLSPLEPVMKTFPEDGAYAHPTSMADPASRVAVVFSRGIVRDLLIPDLFHVRDPDGAEVSVTPWLYYGQDSHVVVLLPAADWAEDTVYTVEVDPGVVFIDGTQSEAAASFTFYTGDPLEEEPVRYEECGCASVSPAPFSLLGLLALRRRR